MQTSFILLPKHQSPERSVLENECLADKSEMII